jgi:hypothetical protein
MLVSDEKARWRVLDAQKRAGWYGVPSTLSAAEWLAILAASEGKCHYCGDSVGVDTLELEHVVALASGGGNVRENVVAACRACNSSKGYDREKAAEHGNGIQPKAKVAKVSVCYWFPVELTESMKPLARQHNRSLVGEIVTALQEYITRHAEQASKQAA